MGVEGIESITVILNVRGQKSMEIANIQFSGG
jgi:hypothetical protein